MISKENQTLHVNTYKTTREFVKCWWDVESIQRNSPLKKISRSWKDVSNQMKSE